MINAGPIAKQGCILPGLEIRPALIIDHKMKPFNFAKKPQISAWRFVLEKNIIELKPHQKIESITLIEQ